MSIEAEVAKFHHANIDIILMRYADQLDDITQSIVRVAYMEGVAGARKVNEILTGENNEHTRQD